MTHEDVLHILEVFIFFCACFFLVSQFELCVAMPEEWFQGLASGIGLVIGVWLRFRRRE